MKVTANIRLIKFSLFLLISACDYGFDVNVYLREGLDSSQTDLGPSEMAEIRLGTLGGDALALDPVFSSGVTEYTSQIPRSEASLILFWEARDPSAQVFFNADTPVETEGQREILLENETTILTLRLKGSNLTQTSYTLRISKEKALSSETALKNLTLGEFELNPAFSPDHMEYEAVVPKGTSAAYLKSVFSWEKENELQKTEKLLPLSNTLPITLRVLVTAEDQSTRTYEVYITEEP